METEVTARPLVGISTRDGVRILTLDNPPVNAFSAETSTALVTALDEAGNDRDVRAIVLAANNAIFSGGADIAAFRRQPGPNEQSVRDVVAHLESNEKTLVAALDGAALGGGFETALACDYRVASARAKVGLPEILLGLIPGAGGTQRLPRLLAQANPHQYGGVQMALQMMLDGKPRDAKVAVSMGLLDELVDGDLLARAVELAKEKAGTKRRLSALEFWVPPPLVALAHGMVPAEDKGGYAGHKLVDAMEAASDLDFAAGIAREHRLFNELLRGTQAQSAVHLFFAERELGKIPGLDAAVVPKTIARAAVVGAGTMGTGIAMVFANAGIPVWVIDVNPEQVERGKKNVADTYDGQVKKGKLSAERAAAAVAAVQFVTDYGAIAEADLVVEAVFESMAVKKEVFAALDKAIKRDAILASNTSTLDIDEIASATTRPEQVLGLHFFAPANVMQLLEIVRAKATSDEALATAVALAKKLKKKGVVSGNAFGFIGNRMLFDYIREASFLLEEGATPWQVDEAIRNFGFPMGPFAMCDLSGIDVFYKIRQEAPDPGYRQSDIGVRLYEQKRLGQKTGGGYFLYENGARKPTRDPEVERLIEGESRRLNVTRREIGEAEIVERCMFALVNQGAELLGSGVALRPGDEDIAWVFGYGFPWWHGGPMWWADTVGAKTIYDRIVGWRESLGEHWVPAAKLKEAAERGSFAPRPSAGALK